MYLGSCVLFYLQYSVQYIFKPIMKEGCQAHFYIKIYSGFHIPHICNTYICNVKYSVRPLLTLLTEWSGFLRRTSTDKISSILVFCDSASAMFTFVQVIPARSSICNERYFQFENGNQSMVCLIMPRKKIPASTNGLVLKNQGWQVGNKFLFFNSISF